MLSLTLILLSGFAITANANNHYRALSAAKSCLQTSDQSCRGSGHIIDSEYFLLEADGQKKLKEGEYFLKVIDDVVTKVDSKNKEHGESTHKLNFVDLDYCDTVMHALRHPYSSIPHYADQKRKLRVKKAWYCYPKEYTPGWEGAQEFLQRQVTNLLSSSDYVRETVSRDDVETLTNKVLEDSSTTFRTYIDHESHNMIAYLESENKAVFTLDSWKDFPYNITELDSAVFYAPCRSKKCMIGEHGCIDEAITVQNSNGDDVTIDPDEKSFYSFLKNSGTLPNTKS